MHWLRAALAISMVERISSVHNILSFCLFYFSLVSVIIVIIKYDFFVGRNTYRIIWSVILDNKF